MTIDYAIVETGGKQYRVHPGQIIAVEKIVAEEGSTIELDRVLLVFQNDQVTLGRPTVEGAKVLAEVREQGRGEKITVIKYKPKVRHTIKQGHRQSLTKLAIKEIVTGGSAGRASRRRRQTSGA